MNRLLLNCQFVWLMCFFIPFISFAQTTSPCTQYEIISTNNNCGCSDFLFRPYGLFVETNNACGLEYYKPDTVFFEIRNDSTAAIRGVFRTFEDWRPIRVDITLAKASTGTPRLDLCLKNSPPSVAAQWRYFGAMTGTIQFDGAAPLSVSSRDGQFQVGVGANGQNSDMLGGSGFFTLSNGQRGGFGFNMVNPANGSCIVSTPCDTDATPPTFSNCPNNITLSTAGNNAIANWTTPTATDNCSNPSVSANFNPGATFPIGSTTVIYTAKDAKNNTAECRFNIIVNRLDPCDTDATPPTFSNCPNNITLSTAGNNAIANWIAPTATDNCSNPSVSANFNPGATFPIGSTTVIYTAKDAKNNTAECRFNITVNRLDPCDTDATPATFSNCPNNITLSTAGNNAIANWVAPTATDNCSTPSVSANFNPGATFPIGSTTVIYTAKDAKNNTAECRFNVIVNSFNPDTNTCIDYEVGNTNNICGCTSTQWVPYSLFIEQGNGCGEYYVADSVRFRINTDSSARLTGWFRTTTWRPVWLDVQWSKTNQQAARFSTCSNDTTAAQQWRFFGTAQGNIQFDNNHLLNVSNEGLLQVGTGANGQNKDLYGAGGVIKLSDGRTVNINIALKNPLPDACLTSCANDVTAPTINNCPQNITQLTIKTPVAASWAAPSVRDACSSPILSATHLPDAAFEAGETTVVYTARDVKGNQSQCSFKVVIKPVKQGNLCQTYAVENTNDACGCAASQWKPYALRIGSDNCGDYYKADSVILYINGDSSARLQGRFRSDTWQPVVVNMRFAKTALKTARFELCQTNNPFSEKWRYFDNMSGTITIGDANPIQVNTSSLLQIGEGANGQNANLMGGSVRFKLANGLDGSFNFLLTNPQQFECSDIPCGVDIAQPIIQNCPRDTSIVTDKTSVVVNWITPTATDDCTPSPILSSNFSSGHLFTTGSTVVIYTARDNAGNTSQCRFTVNVVQNLCLSDTMSPVLHNCPTNRVVTTTQDSVQVTWTAPTATDNCSTPSVSGNFASGTFFRIGNTTIIITARDTSGNTSQCHFTVTVQKSTSIFDPHNLLATVALSPNPAYSQLNLAINSPIADNMYITISNTLGQSVMQQKVSIQSGDNQMPIDVSDLTNGMYYLTIRYQNSVVAKPVRFMKL